VLLFFFFLRIVIAQGWYIGMNAPIIWAVAKRNNAPGKNNAR
jgi:hypothetical protein